MPLSRHPRNTAFSWPDRPTDSLRCLTPAQVNAFNADGFCVLKNAVPENDLSKVLAETDRAESTLTSSTIMLEDDQTYVYDAAQMSFAVNLVKRSTVIRDFFRQPLFQHLSHDLLGRDIRLYWDQAVYKKPKSGGLFPWHQDNGYTFTEPQDYLTCWIALNDATKDNGCPWVIPKLHRQGTLVHQDSPRGWEIKDIETSGNVRFARACPAQAGDMVIFSSLTPHKTGPNISEEVRKALIVQFATDGMCLIEKDGTRRPQNDPLLNMVILENGAPPIA